MENSADQRPREEAAWVAQALAGDALGFEALVRRYHAPLKRMLHAVLHNQTDVEDLLQETFLRAWRFLHRYDPARPFGPWLLRIGVNLARNHLRKRKAAVELSLDRSPGVDEEEPFDGPWLADERTLRDLDYRRLLDETRAALAALPDEQRVVLEMRVLAEMSYQGIATALAIPIGTVMSRLNRGRRRVQEVLASASSETASAASPETVSSAPVRAVPSRPIARGPSPSVSEAP